MSAAEMKMLRWISNVTRKIKYKMNLLISKLKMTLIK